MRAYRNSHPENKRKWFITKRHKAFERKRAVIQLLGASGCADCGIKDVRVLAFHHRDAKQKKFRMSRGFAEGYAMDRVLEEAKKCDVLCSNCHIIRHYKHFPAGAEYLAD